MFSYAIEQHGVYAKFIVRVFSPLHEYLTTQRVEEKKKTKLPDTYTGCTNSSNNASNDSCTTTKPSTTNVLPSTKVLYIVVDSQPKLITYN